MIENWIGFVIAVCGVYVVRSASRVSTLIRVAGPLLFGFLIGWAVGQRLWFAELCGLCGVATLTLQSAASLAMRSTGEMQGQYRDTASRAWWMVVVSYVAVLLGGLAIQPTAVEAVLREPLVCGLVVMTLAGLIGGRLCLEIDFDLGVCASSLCIAASLAATATLGRPLSVWTVAGFAAAVLCELSVRLVRNPTLPQASPVPEYREAMKPNPAMR